MGWNYDYCFDYEEKNSRRKGRNDAYYEVLHLIKIKPDVTVEEIRELCKKGIKK
jgi:hypothetical protein